LTKEDATITIEQYAAENPGSDPSKADYKLWLETSFKGWTDDGKRTRYQVSYDDIVPGKKLEEWNADWGKRAAEGLTDRIQRDRKALRARRSASARFATVLPMVEIVRRCEDQVPDEIGGMLSDEHSGKTERQRAYRAWSYIQARDAKTYEREVSDVTKSTISAIGKPGPQAPTVVTPPRDMRMPRTIEEAVNCKAYGPQSSQTIADEIAYLDSKNCYEGVEMKDFMKSILALKPVFKVKFNTDGTIDKFKCRLVVGGHKAIKGQYFDETYSPVLSLVIL
jgi:uncharacterized protein YndB with AHSA1/START domain